VLALRMGFELSIIGKTGFIDYFLVVWDFIALGPEHGIPVGPGRGSGAGCIVAYLLGITNLDPLRFKLLFERFLNPERVSPPDFDIDFCMRRRGEVIDYVREKYGKDCVANIITYGTLGAKMVIRDVSRVHNLPYADADRLAKMIPDELNIELESAIKNRGAAQRGRQESRSPRKIVDQARVLEGMVRNTGKHAAGIIITDRPLDEFVPLTEQEGDVTVQFDMNAVGKLGLLKMDFLGLKTLTVIADAVDNIRRTADPKFDIEAVGFDDPKTYALLNSGRTTGVFQLESGGMQNALPPDRPLQHRRDRRPHRALPPGPDGLDPRLRPRQEGPQHRQATPTRSSRPSVARPTASWSTRNRSWRPPRSSPATPSAAPTCSAAPWARRTPTPWRRSAPSSSRAPSG
jgi:DNA polymerase-3 subunit alpha